ncbi:MAG: CoA transferase [Gemmatimonadetes bacterium]|nr:CoA transferase [Gemmatimonadota bacterium]
MAPLPLDGILVVSVEQALAAPFATRRLADAGARVIKVERPEGDFARDYDEVVHGESTFFVWSNRGKESVVLDFKTEAGAALLGRLIARADVFVQNLVPGALERVGFGTAALRERHPRLITCDLSGYGEAAPYASMKAYDMLVQSESALVAVTGTPDAPARVGISVCDIGAGMHAHAAIVEALLLRQRTGAGTALKVSLFDAMADWMTVPYLHHVYGGRAPARSGLAHAAIAPYGPYRTADGSLMIAIQNEREWTRLCERVLARPDLARDPRFRTNSLRVAERAELAQAIEDVFTTLRSAEVGSRLLGADIAFARINSVADFAAHPALRLMRVSTPSGPVELPVAAVAWMDEGAGPRAVPALGEHTDAIRREFPE